MTHYFRIAGAVCALVLLPRLSWGAVPEPGTWFDCTDAVKGPAVRWCRDVKTLSNAWYVYGGIGSVHLKNGAYTSPSGRLHIAFVNQPSLISISGRRAAVLSTARRPGASAVLYLSLLQRTPDGYFRNDSTVKLGTGIRPFGVNLRGDRVRVSIVVARRETILIFHVTSRGLQAAATRYAQ